MIKPVDCHCHLDFDKFDGDRDEVIARAIEKLEFAVTVGCSVERNKKTIEVASKYEEFLVFNLGLHPTFTDDFKNLDKVKEQIMDNDPVAVGEIGLDHHHVNDEETQRRQREVFEELLELAEDMQKPVNVHSRDAEQETIDVLKRHDLPDVLIHCFNGTIDEAVEAVENGMTIGVTTQVLYSEQVQSIVDALDLDNIVLETDSPFLYRGGRNEPSNVVESAEKIAEIKNCSVDEVVEETSRNARKIFSKD